MFGRVTASITGQEIRRENSITSDVETRLRVCVCVCERVTPCCGFLKQSSSIRLMLGCGSTDKNEEEQEEERVEEEIWRLQWPWRSFSLAFSAVEGT